MIARARGQTRHISYLVCAFLLISTAAGCSRSTGGVLSARDSGAETTNQATVEHRAKTVTVDPGYRPGGDEGAALGEAAERVGIDSFAQEGGERLRLFDSAGHAGGDSNG